MDTTNYERFQTTFLHVPIDIHKKQQKEIVPWIFPIAETAVTKLHG